MNQSKRPRAKRDKIEQPHTEKLCIKFVLATVAA